MAAEVWLPIEGSADHWVSNMGPRPNYLAVARHLNDEKTDNRLENVAWGTRKENAADMRRNREKAAGQEELAV